MPGHPPKEMCTTIKKKKSGKYKLATSVDERTLRVLFSRKYVHPPIYAAVQQEALKQQHCARGGTNNKGRHHCMCT